MTRWAQLYLSLFMIVLFSSWTMTCCSASTVVSVFNTALFQNIVFSHVVLSAAVLDINHQLLIVALAIVPSKRTLAEFWMWFLNSLTATALGYLINYRLFLWWLTPMVLWWTQCKATSCLPWFVLTNSYIHIIRNMKAAKVWGKKIAGWR